MEGVEHHIYAARQEKLLEARYLLDLAEEVWGGGLAVVVEVAVELVEEEDVHAPDPIPLIHRAHPLLL